MAGSTLSAVQSGIGLIAGGAEFFDSLSKEKADKKSLSEMRMPFYQIQNEYYQNQAGAAELAGQGTPTAELNYLTDQAGRGLGSTIEAVNRAGGGINDVSKLLDSYNQQIGKIGAESAAQHVENIKYFHKMNSELAGQKTMQWSINQYQPYEAKLKELNESIKTDEANKWAGISTAVGALTAGGTSMQNADLMKKLFPSDKGGGVGELDPTNLASTSSGGGSPAANFSTIDPSSFSQAAVAGSGGSLSTLSSLAIGGL